MRKLLQIVLATLALGLGVAGQASATFFTLDAPVVIDGSEVGNPGVLGTLMPVFDLSGSILLDDVGGNLIPDEGGTTFVGVDVFVFDLVLSNGSASVDALGISVGTPNFFLNPVGAGAFNDLGLVGPTSVLADNVATLGGQFDFSGDSVDQNETTVRLFVTYSPLGDIALGQTVNFMVSSGTDFTVQGLVGIPEPSTALLVGGGLLAFGLLRTRRS